MVPSSPIEPVRFAIVGLDHWYAAIPFAEKVASCETSELYAIVDRDVDRAEEVGARTGCRRTSADLVGIIDDPQVDVVACFTSVDASAELCIAAAEAGKHIVSVKPMAMTLSEADRVVEAVEHSGVHFVPSESRRRSPLALRLSDLIHSGQLGDLRAGTFAMHSSLPMAWPGAADPGWWVDPKRVPGGGWLDHAVYQLDRMEWLFESPVIDISGSIARIANPELALEDYGHAVITLESGAVVTIEDTWIAPRGAGSNRGHLVGSAGAVQWDRTIGLLGVATADGEWTFSKMPSDTFDTFETVLAAIATGAHAGPANDSPVRRARRTLQLCLDFYAAAEDRSVTGR